MRKKEYRHNMNSLIVMYKENKDNPENTWSGTSYALRKALEKYTDIVFIDSSDTRIMIFLSKIYCKLSRTCLAGCIGKIYEYMEQKRAKKLLKPYPNKPVLEICNDVLVENPYYLYQDLSYANWIEARKKINALGKKFSDGNLNVLSKNELNRKMILQTKLYQKAEKVFYMGHWTTEEMKTIYPQMAETFVHAGGGLNRDFQMITSDNRDSHRIVFLGIDFERKGGDLVLDAFRILRKTMDPEANLMIIGPEKRAEEDGVSWCGRLERFEIGKILSASGIFCMPSRFEAYGLAFVEALCYGLPVIARDDYEMSYFIHEGQNGYLLKNEDAHELAVLMNKAIINKKMQEFVKAHTEEYLSTYSWDRVAQKIANTIFTEEANYQ